MFMVISKFCGPAMIYFIFMLIHVIMAYHRGLKKDGSNRKVTSHRAIFVQESKDHYWTGWRRKWSKYLNNWDLLEQ